MQSVRLRAAFLALLAAVAVTSVALATASATPNKPYSIVICGGGQIGCTAANPAVIAPGGTVGNPSALSVTFTNDNKAGSGIQLGSDNLSVPSAPAGFSILGASQSGTPLPQCPASFNDQAPLCFSLLNGNTTIGFRNLDLDPGQSISIDMTAVTPPPSTTSCTKTSPCSWSDQAKESNDFSGTGNQLNPDSNSAYGTVTSAVASCAKLEGCGTELANGGTATSAPGSIDVRVATSNGDTAVTQLESLNFGTPLPPSKCSDVSSPNLTYEVLSHHSDRSQRITINTTDFPGYVSEACLEAQMDFTQLVIGPDGKKSLAPANPTTLPDGSPGFQGLLADCGRQALQVNCSTNPGVVERETTGNVHTLVAAIPRGFDMRIGN